MNGNIEIELTSDGSHTLYLPSLDEHYHSVNGAVQESRHVFIEAGLNHSNKEEINILEVGFGTGLNAFLTYLNTSQKFVRYTGFELYPLTQDLLDKLNYTENQSDSEKKIYNSLHQSEWNKEIQITPNFLLTKFPVDFKKLEKSFTTPFDVIYYDAFAPDKQPEMWTQEIFNYLYSYTAKGGILTTYCAKGIVRRMLQQAGYSVEKLPGPPGKREMLRATKF